MNADALTDDVPGEVELADGASRYNPDPLPPDIGLDQELTRLHSEAEFGLGHKDFFTCDLMPTQALWFSRLEPGTHRTGRLCRPAATVRSYSE